MHPPNTDERIGRIVKRLSIVWLILLAACGIGYQFGNEPIQAISAFIGFALLTAAGLAAAIFVMTVLTSS